jgi:NitT/TauT family transport system substrate-binding protein
MKKTIIPLLLLLIVILFTGCDQADQRHLKINVAAPDGAPLLSIAKMWSDNPTILEDYTVTYKYNGADDLTAALISKSPDLAIAPINLAAKLYNENVGYRLAGVSIWGMMHLVSNQTISSITELKGKNIFAFAKAGTPGITIRSILTQYDVAFTENIDGTIEGDKANLIYLSEAGNLRDAMIAGKVGNIDVQYGVLPEPVATAIAGATASLPHGQYSVKINLATAWKSQNNGENYPQAGLIFHERLLSHDQAFLNAFIDQAALSTSWAFANPEEAGNLAKSSLGSAAIPGGAPVKAAVNAGRLPLEFTLAPLAKTSVNNYLTIILNDSASSLNLIGGKLPDDNFYYQK